MTHEEMHRTAGHAAAEAMIQEQTINMVRMIDAVIKSQREMRETSGVGMCCLPCILMTAFASVAGNILLRVPDGHADEMLRDMHMALDTTPTSIEKARTAEQGHNVNEN